MKSRLFLIFFIPCSLDAAIHIIEELPSNKIITLFNDSNDNEAYIVLDTEETFNLPKNHIIQFSLQPSSYLLVFFDDHWCKIKYNHQYNNAHQTFYLSTLSMIESI